MSSTRGLIAVVGALVLALDAGQPVAAGEPVGSPTAQQALALCDAIDDHPAAEQWEYLAHALTLAEQAVAIDEHDAKAHFAVFCTLAKRTSISGYSLRSLLTVRRLHREIDTTLSLAPDYTDALIAKGAFLLNMPRLLGGDARAAESLLRRALELEPDRISAQIYLAAALYARDQRAAAQAQAEQALAAALRANRPSQADEARALIARYSQH